MIGQLQQMLLHHGSFWVASYYRHYISEFSAIAAPLNGLTQKGTTYTWTAACADAFQALKTA